MILLHGGCAVRVRGRERPLVQGRGIHGELRLSTRQHSEELKSPTGTRENKSSITQEELYVHTEGDVFDPKLMTYAAGVGMGLVQQRYSTDRDSDSSSGNMNSYRLITNFLSGKPYPFSVSLSKEESYLPRRFRSPLHMENTSSGVLARWQNSDWPMTLSWTDNEIRQTADLDDSGFLFGRRSKRFAYSVSHDFSDRSHLDFRFDMDDVVQTGAGHTRKIDSKSYRLNHDYNFGPGDRHSLTSHVSLVDRQSDIDTRTLEWQESLLLRHTDRFSTFYSAHYSESTFESIKSRTIGGVGGFTHRLYDNFTTRLSLFANKTEFGRSSESISRGGDLRFNYYRHNPWGLLTAEYSFRMANRESTGDTGTDIVIDESHTFTDPFPIVLEKRDVLIDTIVVKNADGTEIYTEGDDYTVRRVGDRVELEITTLGVDLPNISDGQELYVDYLYAVESSVTEDLLEHYFRVEQQFNNGFSVYYAHQNRQTEIDFSREAAFNPDEDYRSDTFGAAYRLRNITLTAEHREIESTHNSSESDRITASGHWSLSPTTSIHGQLAQAWIDSTGDRDRQTSLFTARAGVKNRLTRHLTLTADAELRRENSSDIGRTDGLRFDAGLEYHQRDLSIRGGWGYYVLDRRNTETTNSMFFVKLVRRF